MCTKRKPFTIKHKYSTTVRTVSDWTIPLRVTFIYYPSVVSLIERVY